MGNPHQTALFFCSMSQTAATKIYKLVTAANTGSST